VLKICHRETDMIMERGILTVLHEIFLA